MRQYDVVQGSREWFEVRKGIPTASEIDKLLTPKTLKLSSQADKYLHKLLAEWCLDTPFEVETRVWQMDVGIDREQEAVEYYELTSGYETTPAGFCLSDDGSVGASPDRFVGDEGLLEIKNPTPPVQVAYLLADELPADYVLQTQTQLYVTGRRWLDFMAYVPAMPALLVRVYPDPTIHHALATALAVFTLRLQEGKAVLAALREG